MAWSSDYAHELVQPIKKSLPLKISHPLLKTEKNQERYLKCKTLTMGLKPILLLPSTDMELPKLFFGENKDEVI